MFTYREHIATLSDTDTSEKELGRILESKSGGEKIGTWILSSDAFGEKTSQNTAAELLKSGAPKFPEPQPANMNPGSRVIGWRFVSNLISADTWFISDMCPEALAAIPSLEYDSDKGGEDIRKTDHLYDDCGDCLRYSLVDMLSTARVPNIGGSQKLRRLRCRSPIPRRRQWQCGSLSQKSASTRRGEVDGLYVDGVELYAGWWCCLLHGVSTARGQSACMLKSRLAVLGSAKMGLSPRPISSQSMPHG